ncbi:MAG TPA: D-alanyl-D-alanine carboxypeptidase/D-alanyl-D-alanine-endopeptidase [Tepidisphaeraceae bacterium]|jgi:D-alanyl-D-alanine carboxypeptidase/D-alanyl-D-alanine-endopeptidase (penicillin-binding protein 4)
MKFSFVACVISLFAFSFAARADLNNDVASILHDPHLARVDAGVCIARLDAHQAHIIFNSHADVPHTPASNLKIITTSAALARLGTNFQFHTRLLQHGNDLIIVGDGDPTFGDSDLNPPTHASPSAVLQQWASALKAHNISSVNNILIDDAVFDEQFYHPHWPADQYPRKYAAEVAGLSLNANCIDVAVRPSSGHASYTLDPQTNYVAVKNTCTAGRSTAVWLTRENGNNQLILRGTSASPGLYSITIHDPPLYTGQAFADILRANGITITGQVRRDRNPGPGPYVSLATYQTPLSAVIDRANKDSVNLYAESLCKRLGFAATGTSGSWSSGTAAVGAFLVNQAHVSPDEFHLDDGCGLSHQDRISAGAILRVLCYDFYSPSRDIFMSSLAIAGKDGTLSKRFRGSSLDGRVFAKTGFVNNVSCLSGFLKSKSGQWYAFSIMFNNIPMYSNSTYKPIQERIVEAVDRAGV